ncbi:hypothetical protein ACHWQZ_G007030 [Mnemiopsis leidyi]
MILLLILTYSMWVSCLATAIAFDPGIPCTVKESHGFLKSVCDDGDPDHVLYKCFNSDEFYRHDPSPSTSSYFQGDVCSNDPHFYQACNRELSPKVTNSELLCEMYLCSPKSNTLTFDDTLFSSIDLARYGLLCYPDLYCCCKNIEVDKSECSAESELTMSGEMTGPRESYICNDVCDGVNTVKCEEEAVCNGYRYGLYCTSQYTDKLTYVPPRWICDGQGGTCKSNEDEADCDVIATTKTACRHARTGDLVPVHNYTRCTAIHRSSYNTGPLIDNKAYCVLEDVVMYQTNCSDPSRVGLSCEINGYLSTVSKFIICTDLEEGEIFGLTRKTSVIVPNDRQECDHMYGELYLYTSCGGRCLDAECPLRTTPRYKSCPAQFPKRVGTIVNNEYLIFLTKSRDNMYTNRCNSSGNLIPKTKLCDGRIECSDLSDECNEQCSKQILEGGFLKVLSWMIGLLAFLANFVIITKSLITLKKCRTSVALINRLLIIMIAIGDLLIGCYLLIIATYDGVIFRNYCQNQISWVTSLKCSAIGIFSTIGSQISLFSMTGLSIVRMHGILRSMRIPGEVTHSVIVRSSVVVLSFVFFSVTIAAVPIIESLEDFFVNGVKFADGLNIFIGTSTKSTIFAVIEAYHGRAKHTTLKWGRLIKMVADMFSHDLDYEDLTERVDKVGFYGNDGVCLFKYFVKNDDPQRLFVWTTLLLNFICFIFICISYIFIGIVGQRSSNSLKGSQNNKQLTQRNNRMNQRIAFIITTDFLCWVPFIVICILHSTEVIDASPWYSVFSMVILSINSVINPLLYDKVVTNAFKTPILAMYGRISASSFLQSSHRRVDPVLTETVELTPMPH